MLWTHPEDPAPSTGKLAQLLIHWKILHFLNVPEQTPLEKWELHPWLPLREEFLPSRGVPDPKHTGRAGISILNLWELFSEQRRGFFFWVLTLFLQFIPRKHLLFPLWMGFFYLHWRIPRKRIYLGKTIKAIFNGISWRAHPTAPKNSSWFFPPHLFLLFPTQDFFHRLWKLLSQNSWFSDALIFILIPGRVHGWSCTLDNPALLWNSGSLGKSTDSSLIWGNSEKTNRKYRISTPVPAGFEPCPPLRCFMFRAGISLWKRNLWDIPNGYLGCCSQRSKIIWAELFLEPKSLFLSVFIPFSYIFPGNFFPYPGDSRKTKLPGLSPAVFPKFFWFPKLREKWLLGVLGDEDLEMQSFQKTGFLSFFPWNFVIFPSYFYHFSLRFFSLSQKTKLPRLFPAVFPKFCALINNSLITIINILTGESHWNLPGIFI